MSWTLVYQNDSAGNRAAGDIGSLIHAVRNGSTVKVVLESETVFPRWRVVRTSTRSRPTRSTSATTSCSPPARWT
jgi:hypothetical protein